MSDGWVVVCMPTRVADALVEYLDSKDLFDEAVECILDGDGWESEPPPSHWPQFPNCPPAQIDLTPYHYCSYKSNGRRPVTEMAFVKEQAGWIRLHPTASGWNDKLSDYQKPEYHATSRYGFFQPSTGRWVKDAFVDVGE